MSHPDDLLRGKPRFPEGPLARRAADDGALAAWREALRAGSIDAAAASATGDFAVALHDATGGIHLAVDRLGLQTLCYRVEGPTLRFAERADALADGRTPLDPQALYDYLYFHTIPSPRAIFQGVHRLPPGYCASFVGGQLHVRPYWTPRFTPDRQAHFNELRQEFLDILERAMKRHVALGMPACFLSGGTDSSTVVGMLARVSGQVPDTYSIGFDAEGYDEMAYARTAARHFGARHHEYYVTPDDLVASIPAMAAHVDQPFGNSSVVPAYHCARMAAADGVTRMLAGDGGDELFGGNSRYATQRLFDLYGDLPAPLRHAALEPLLNRPELARLPLLRRAASYVRQARTPMPDRQEQYNLLRRLGPSTVLTPAFLAQVDTEAPLHQQRAVWARAEAPDELDRHLAYDWRYTLAETDLPKVRWATGMAGVDVGFPLLDDELLQFSMRLRADYKLRGFKLRWFFKEALRGFLPNEIIRKKKHGFGLPFGVWVLRHARLRDLVAGSLDQLVKRGLVQGAFGAELIRQRLAEHPGYYGEMAWILTMLEQWLASRDRLGGHSGSHRDLTPQTV